MVLIVDDSSRRRKTDLRNLLYSAGIPCAVSNSNQLKKRNPARITVAFAENETQLAVISIRAGATDYIVINDTDRRMINGDAYFYKSEFDGMFDDFIKRRALNNHGISIDDTETYPARFNSRGSFFFNRAVNLTALEKMIVRHLMFAKGEWHSADEIVQFAYDGTGRSTAASVSVHICNINKKSQTVSGKKLILAKRFHGYKINVLESEKKKRGPYNIKADPPRYV